MKYPNIEAERARVGMNMEALAAELGVTRKTLYNWINGGNIPQSALNKMSTIFHCSVDYLLGRCVHCMAPKKAVSCKNVSSSEEK